MNTIGAYISSWKTPTTMLKSVSSLGERNHNKKWEQFLCETRIQKTEMKIKRKKILNILKKDEVGKKSERKWKEKESRKKAERTIKRKGGK